MEISKQGTKVELGTKVVELSEIESLFQREQITLMTLVALGISPEKKIEVTWIRDGYPIKLKEKQDLPVPVNPGFYYFKSIQKWSDARAIFVECEPEAIRFPGFTPLVETIGRVILDTEEFRTTKTIRDLHLVTPKEDTILGAYCLERGTVKPLWEGKGTAALQHPRLGRGGIFATRDRELLFFPFIGDEKRFLTAVDDAKIIAALPETIKYLSRFFPGKDTIVATTMKTMKGMRYVFSVREAMKSHEVTATILVKNEGDAEFVGTPGGNGIPHVLEIGKKAGQRTLRISPKDSAHVRELVAAAC